MDILKKLDKNTKILNISNCGLKGVLDLEDFEVLEELYCANNEITEIIYYSYNVKYVDCSFNKLKYLVVPHGAKNILYNGNGPITKIYYFSDKQIQKYPNTIKTLIFEDGFNEKINNLPISLLKLALGTDYNQVINNLPNSLLLLKVSFKQEFNKNINYLPNSIEKLILRDDFNEEINNLPNSIVYLALDGYINQEINNLPVSIKYLCVYSISRNSFFNKIPNTINYLKIQGCGFRKINNIPSSITHLELDSFGYMYVDEITSPITHLKLGKYYKKKIYILPETIQEIIISDTKQYNLIPKKEHCKIKLLEKLTNTDDDDGDNDFL